MNVKRLSRIKHGVAWELLSPHVPSPNSYQHEIEVA